MASFSDLFSSLRSGAESWKTLSGSKKAKKLTDTLDKVGNALYGGPQAPGASPPENPIQAPAAPAALEGPRSIPTWGLLALGAGLVYLAVRR